MTTLNISLPEKLRDQVDSLVKKGHFASVSDAIRTALRDMVLSEQLDGWFKDAKKDEKAGRAVIIKNKLDLARYLDSPRETPNIHR